MCCFTHGNVVYGPPAADKRMQCRCGIEGNGQCDRQADAEDLLCAVCRVGLEPPTFINPSDRGELTVFPWTRAPRTEPPFPGGSGETPHLLLPDR